MDIVKLCNRIDTRQEFMFDSVTYVLEPGEEVDMQEDAAKHGYAKLVAKLDPVTNQQLYLTGLKDRKGNEITDCSPMDYNRMPHEELLDRTNMDGQFKTIPFGNPDAAKGRVLTPQEQAALSSTHKPSRPAAPAHLPSARAQQSQDKGEKLEENLGDKHAPTEGTKDNLDVLGEILEDEHN